MSPRRLWYSEVSASESQDSLEDMHPVQPCLHIPNYMHCLHNIDIYPSPS